MAIFFKKVQRVNPQDKTAPKKWFISLRSIGLLRSKEIGKRVSDGTTLDPKEGEMAFSRFGKVLVKSLLDSYTVEIEDLGTFRLTASSEGADTKDEASAKNIKGLYIRFTPYESTRDSLSKATFKDVDTMQ